MTWERDYQGGHPGAIAGLILPRLGLMSCQACLVCSLKIEFFYPKGAPLHCPWRDFLGFDWKRESRSARSTPTRRGGNNAETIDQERAAYIAERLKGFPRSSGDSAQFRGQYI